MRRPTQRRAQVSMRRPTSSGTGLHAAPEAPSPYHLQVPTPRTEVIAPKNHRPDEVETLAELEERLSTGGLAGVSVQGIPLTGFDLTAVDVRGALFVGCAMTTPQ